MLEQGQTTKAPLIERLIPLVARRREGRRVNLEREYLFPVETFDGEIKTMTFFMSGLGVTYDVCALIHCQDINHGKRKFIVHYDRRKYLITSANEENKLLDDNPFMKESYQDAQSAVDAIETYLSGFSMFFSLIT